MESLSSGSAPKNPVIPVCCDLGAFTESERVVRSWSGFQCGTARTVRYATFEERRAAAVHADVGRYPELRFSGFQRFS